jgi:hypothetical protein
VHPHLGMILAKQHQQDLMAAAARTRSRKSAAADSQDPYPAAQSILVRMATAGDRSSLKRLAAFHSTKRPTGPTLLGVLLQRPAAALSLIDGSVLVDPTVATDDLVALLRLRARQLREPLGRGELS